MNIMTKLNIRQKVMLVLTVLAAAFLAWQIYNFVHGNTVEPVRFQSSAPVLSAPPAEKLEPAPPGNISVLKPAVQPLPTNLDNLALTVHQQQYLNLVREYQITKMKRQILEEEAGLASAQKRITDAGRGGSLATIDNFADDVGSSTSGYQLTYLDRQAGEWTATLNQAGQYKEVHVGTRLTDGSKVISINNSGVVIRPVSGHNITLSFQGSFNVDKGLPTYSLAHNPSIKKSAPIASASSHSSPNNAKIAKILGITSTPDSANSAPAASSAAVVLPAPKDIPAAPLTVATPPTPDQVTPVVPSTSATPAPTVKPVSVEELRRQTVALNNDNKP